MRSGGVSDVASRRIAATHHPPRGQSSSVERRRPCLSACWQCLDAVGESERGRKSSWRGGHRPEVIASDCYCCLLQYTSRDPPPSSICCLESPLRIFEMNFKTFPSPLQTGSLTLAGEGMKTAQRLPRTISHLLGQHRSANTPA